MRVLLLTPPMTQLNTPYPATAHLTGFLRGRGVDAVQADPALELVLRLLSKQGLKNILIEISQGCQKKYQKKQMTPRTIQYFLDHSHAYLNTVEPVIGFLQGKDPSLALRIVTRNFLPEGPRFDPLESLDWAFGSLGVQDRAKHLATLYLDDLVDVVRLGIDPRFEFSRYGEKLAASVPVFDPLKTALEEEPTLVDRILDEITEDLFEKYQPTVVGMSLPFPGNVYGGFRMAKRLKELAPGLPIIFGGGYVNTELRSLNDPRVFDFVDFITLDDGEKPMLCVLEHLEGKRPAEGLLRTFVREKGQVVFKSDLTEHDIPHRETGTPTYSGLNLSSYLSIFEMLNPMHRIWSDGRWNKLTLAHGCYWKKCNFCDVSLNYIGKYDPVGADLLVDRIEALVRETGQSGFHFVDEAAPPALLRALAEKLLERGVQITWWGNIRFEKTFTRELAQLLARSGCIAVSGGLEVASDRLLKLMNKGVTVEQVARVTRNFSEAGILVHAYLMYGFPTQTISETVDALERVRQLFEAGCLHSGYWHRFSATAHSPIGKEPGKFGIRLLPEPPVSIARNDLEFEDPTDCDHNRLGEGLRKALYNYMHGAGLDQEVRFWFEEKVPKAAVAADLVERALQDG